MHGWWSSRDGCAVSLAMIAIGLSACGTSSTSSSSSAGAASSGTASAATCPEPSPPAGPAIAGSAGSLDLTLSCALNGHLSQVGPESTCTAADQMVAKNDFRATFVTMLQGQATKFEFDVAYTRPGAYSLAGGDISLVEIVQSDVKRDWSNILSGARGTVTVQANRSGTLAVTLVPRDYDTGGKVKNGAPLAISGSWTCPA